MRTFHAASRAPTLAVLAALAVAFTGCKSSTAPKTQQPSGVYKGTLVGAGASGVLTVTFPVAAVAAGLVTPARISFVRVAYAAAAISVTGSLVITGGSTIALTGTYNASANPQLSIAGGGYAITGNYSASSGVLSGSFTGPGGSGQWTVSAGGTAVKVFCGTYSGSGSGTWNLVLDASNNLTGAANASAGTIRLTGSYVPGTGGVTVTSPDDTKLNAIGMLNATSGAGSGTYTDGTGKSGSWTANTTGC